MSTSNIAAILLYIGLALIGSITAFYNRVKNKLK